MGRGFIEPIAVNSGLAFLLIFAISGLFSNPVQVVDSLAQVGATLLVAYAVQMSWVLENSRKRGADRENWVGFATGVGVCALFGIGIALALGGHSGSLSLLEHLAFGWSVVSIGLLGAWIAMQPWAMYEWTHWFNTEYPDD
jgi:hypothetical protein